MESKGELVFLPNLNKTECDCVTIEEYEKGLVQSLKDNVSNMMTAEILKQAAENLPKSEVDYFKTEEMRKMTEGLTYAGVEIPPKSDNEIRLLIAFSRLSNPACDYCNKKIKKDYHLCTKCYSMYHCSIECRTKDLNHKGWCCNKDAKRDTSRRQIVFLKIK